MSPLPSIITTEASKVFHLQGVLEFQLSTFYHSLELKHEAKEK